MAMMRFLILSVVFVMLRSVFSLKANVKMHVSEIITLTGL